MNFVLLFSFSVIEARTITPVRCGLQFEDTAGIEKNNTRPVIDTGDRIVNGEESLMDEFPWIVSIQNQVYYGRWQHQCGGSIINPATIITAGHCNELFETSINNFRIVAGCHDLRDADDCQTVAIEKEDLTVHEEYNYDTLKNDIAILILKQPLNFTNEINHAVGPVCLPQESQQHYQGMASVAGYGKQFFSQEIEDIETKLQVIDINILPFDYCNESANVQMPTRKFANYFDPDKQICSGFKKGLKDSCQGDSGGPLMIRRRDEIFVIGLVSFGPYNNCASEGRPGMYTKVAAYLHWIYTNIQST